MREILILLILHGFVLVGGVCAQTEPPAADEAKKVSPWKFSGNSSLNFVQSSYSNWASKADMSFWNVLKKRRRRNGLRHAVACVRNGKDNLGKCACNGLRINVSRLGQKQKQR